MTITFADVDPTISTSTNNESTRSIICHKKPGLYNYLYIEKNNDSLTLPSYGREYHSKNLVTVEHPI
jgi:hypothetical protein